MKYVWTIALAACLSGAMVSTGCTTQHTESDKPGLLGGNTHQETTTTKNPITGETSTSHSEQKTP